MKEKLLKRFALLFPDVPEADKKALNSNLTYTNLIRLRVIAWLLVFVMVALILLAVAADNLIESVLFRQIISNIIIIRVLFVVGAAAFLAVSRYPLVPDKMTRLHYFLVDGYLLFNLICFALLSGLVQSSGPGIASSYIIAVIVASTFLYLDWAKSIVIYSLAWVAMTAAISFFQNDWLVAASGITNGTIMTLIAIIISRISYTARVQEFLQKQLIERQKMELAASNEMLQRLTYLDALTDIPNRRFFDEYIIRQWKRSVREKSLLSLIMIDIDMFKKYNDTFGHQAGDECLAMVASILSKATKRPGDLVARYGGEEFAAILPDTDIEGAKQIAEWMQQAIIDLNITHPRVPCGKLTISLGVACQLPTEEDWLEVLIAAADEALYRAKEQGGNTYAVSNTIGLPEVSADGLSQSKPA